METFHQIFSLILNTSLTWILDSAYLSSASLSCFATAENYFHCVLLAVGLQCGLTVIVFLVLAGNYLRLIRIVAWIKTMLDCIILMGLIFLLFLTGMLTVLLRVTSRLFETRCQRLYQKKFEKYQKLASLFAVWGGFCAESRAALHHWDPVCVARCLRCKIAT